MVTEAAPVLSTALEAHPGRRALRRFARHRLAVVSAIALTLLALAAFAGPLFWRYSHDDITDQNSKPPSVAHPLGTDSIGHDVLAQVMRGTQQSLMIALTVAALATLIGTIVGIIAGFRRGRIDAVLMRLVDLVLTVPTIAVAAVLGHNLASAQTGWLLIALVLGLLMWTKVARVVRSVVLELREREFVTASRASGASSGQIMRRHILPNVFGPVIVCVTILVAVAILTETALSFLGFGVRPPDTSLGLLVANAQSAVSTRPWLFYFPGLVILAIALCINFVGDGLRDALDPTHTAQSGLKRRTYLARPQEPADPIPDDVVLAIRSLRVGFQTENGQVSAVEEVDLDIRRGEIIGLVGESGSGKSVTAAAIMGLLPASATVSGAIRFEDRELIGLPEPAFRRLRGARISMVFQDPLSSLSPVHTVGNQVAEAVRVHRACSKAEAWAKAEELLHRVGIPDASRRLRDYPHQFSGGMRQRVVIAMAIANEPDIIIADEPTTALDVTVQAQVLEVLARITATTDTAVLLITHNLGVVSSMASRVAVMYAGRLVEVGDVDTILTRAAMPYTRGLLDAMPHLDQPLDEDLPAIPGSPPRSADAVPGCAFAPRCARVQEDCRAAVPALSSAGPAAPVTSAHLVRCFHPITDTLEVSP